MRAIRITQANWLNAEVAGDANTVKRVSDDMARDAVAIGIAVYAPEYDQDVPPAQAAPVARTETQPDPGDLLDHIEAVADGHPEDSPLVQAEMKMPWSNASKAAWTDWAVHQGADPEQVAGLTKNELMSRYGERL